jgi:uncharacterized membrane protein YeiB
MTAPSVAGAVPVRDRALAPDVARGAMLLLIALANAHVWIYGRPVGMRGYPSDLTGVDRVIAAVQLVLVDGRAYPLFALLFGYGITQLATRRTAAGEPPATVVRLVRRRGWWMVLIGLLHGVLLWAGDIVGAYGLLAVLLAGVLVRGAAGTLIGVAVAGTVFAAVIFGAAALPPPPSSALLPSIADPDPLSAMALRAVEWLGVGVTASVLAVFGAVALGAWAGRLRLLDDPARHRPLLRRLAVAGLGTAVAGGLPLALAVAGVWTPSPPALLLCGVLHAGSGYVGGVGYAALWGLLAAGSSRRTAQSSEPIRRECRSSATSVPRRPGPAVCALRDCGRQSLSCYLAQSVAFAALFPAWTLGLAQGAPLWVVSLVGLGVWLVILLIAMLSERAGLRGPAEVLLRRLTYGRRAPVPDPPAPR